MEIYEILIYVAYFISLFIGAIYLLIFYYNKNKFQINNLGNSIKKDYKVSVIIPAYNKEGIILDTINSVLKQNYKKENLDIIVVNDGSTDNTREVVDSVKDRRVVLYNKKNGGKARALNYGINRAKGSVIVVLDADTLMTQNLIRKAVVNFDDPLVAVVVPTLKPYKPNNILERIQVVEYTLSSFTRKILSMKDSSSAAPACSFFRRDFFTKYGGFDENNITEDFEMALKVQKHNYRIVHLTNAIAYTEVPKRFMDLARQRIRWCYGNLYNLKKYKNMFTAKYGDFGFLFLPMMIISLLLSVSIFIFALVELIRKFLYRFYIMYITNFTFDFRLNFNNILSQLTNPKISLGILLFCLSIMIIYIAKKYTRESKNLDIANKSDINVFTYLLYALIYGIILINFWIIAFYYMIFNKKPSW